MRIHGRTSVIVVSYIRIILEFTDHGNNYLKNNVESFYLKIFLSKDKNSDRSFQVTLFIENGKDV